MTQIKDLNSIAYDGAYFVPIQKADGTTGKILISAIGGSLSAWQLKTSSYTAAAGDRLRINASAGDVVITLPASPTATDADILFQRLDLGTNKVLLRTGTNKFNTQANQDAVFAPASINLIEGISYVNSAIGWLNQHNRLSFQSYTAPVPTSSGTSLTYVSDGDANGAFYYLGTNSLTTAFANPTTSGAVLALASSAFLGLIDTLTDRVASDFYVDNAVNNWVAWDFKTKQLSVSKYTLRNRNDSGGYYMRNWVLEGSNAVTAFNVSGVNGATWTTIDTRTNDTTLTSINLFYTLASNGSQASYRYLRYRSTGIDSSGANFLCMGEFEFYGALTAI